jgi:hypothetical protein
MTTLELINEPVGTALQNTVRQNITENNSVLAGCNVHFLFRGSAIDLQSGKHGIRWLIARILTEAQAEFPRFNGQDNRSLYVQYGLTTDQIISQVRSVNGFDKYPDKTIADYLSVIMTKDNQIASVQMSNREDRNRNCKRPRRKWYLIAE